MKSTFPQILSLFNPRRGNCCKQGHFVRNKYCVNQIIPFNPFCSPIISQLDSDLWTKTFVRPATEIEFTFVWAINCRRVPGLLGSRLSLRPSPSHSPSLLAIQTKSGKPSYILAPALPLVFLLLSSRSLGGFQKTQEKKIK